MQRQILSGLFLLGFLFTAGAVASEPVIRDNGLDPGKPVDVLPQNAVAHAQFLNPLAFLENIEQFLLATIPERLAPPDVQQLLQADHPLLIVLGQHLFGAPLSSETIADSMGLAAGEPVTLTLYPGIPTRSFVLSVPVAAHATFEELLRRVGVFESIEATSLGGKAFVRISVNRPPIQELYAAASASRVYFSGDSALLMLLYKESGVQRLSASPRFSEMISPVSGYDLWLTVDPGLIRPLLPQLETFKYLPLQKLLEARQELLSQIPEQQREMIEGRLAAQWGIQSIEELADYAECVISATYEELFDMVLGGLKAFNGFTVAVRADAAFPQATVLLHSDQFKKESGAAAIPLEKIRTALERIPGEFDHFSVTGRTQPDKPSARFLSWLDRVQAGLAAKNLKATLFERIEKAYKESARPQELSSTVPWSIRACETVNSWPSAAEAESLVSYGKALDEALVFPASRPVTILPGGSADLLAENLRRRAESLEKNRELWADVFADWTSRTPFINWAYRVETDKLENSVTQVTWETALISRGGFFGFNQHELVNRRIYYSRPVGDYLVFHQASRDPSWISGLSIREDGELPPAVAKLLDRIPADVSWFRIDRTLGMVPEAVHVLADLESLAHRDLQAYLSSVRELAAEVSEREELIRKLRRLKFSPLVYSVNQNPETGEIYCLLPGGIVFPRERVVPAVEQLLEDFEERIDRLGGFAAYVRESDGTCETSVIQSTEAISYLVKSVGNAFHKHYVSYPEKLEQLAQRVVTSADRDPQRFEQILVKNPIWEFLPVSGQPRPEVPPPGEREPAAPEGEIPARDAEAPEGCIDLGPHYNASLLDNWHGGATVGNTLAELPSGAREFAGVTFDVRGVIQLNGRNLQAQAPVNFPESVTGIQVDRACEKIHFLHGTGWPEQPGTEIGKFLFHYKDGEVMEMPIVYGTHVVDWWTPPRAEVTESEVAWTGSNEASAAANVSLRLYKTTWTNPRPDAELQSVDYVSAGTGSAPFLIAITVE